MDSALSSTNINCVGNKVYVCMYVCIFFSLFFLWLTANQFYFFRGERPLLMYFKQHVSLNLQICKSTLQYLSLLIEFTILNSY